MPALPSVHDLEDAHHQYQTQEFREIFYRTSREWARTAHTDQDRLQALQLILTSWNFQWYQRRHRPLPAPHWEALRQVLALHRLTLDKLSTCRLRIIDLADRPDILPLVQDFIKVLDPVGMSKALHILAPSCFPLWDQSIRKAFQIPTAGRNAKDPDHYWRWMMCVRDHWILLGSAAPDDFLKRFDEWAMVEFTYQSSPI